MKYYVIVFLFALFNLPPHQMYGQCNRANDSLALVSIFNNCLGTGWSTKTNWLVPGKDISTWYGVKLNPAGCVESITMSSNKMNGALPDSIGLLKSLKILTLSNNNLSGNLPVSIGSLIALEELNLSSNKLNGPIHASFGNLINLKKMQINLNNFSGNLPPSLGSLQALLTLYLHQNNFNGTLPANLGNLANLDELLLSQNQFTGSIPAQWGNLSKLRSLIISQNNLSGNIPPEIGNMTNLSFFYADENQFSGSIPPQIGSLVNLKEIWLHKNQLTGNIPVEITNLTKLQKILLNDNMLTGSIPDNIGNLSDLISLHLSSNLISGDIPNSIGNLTKTISLLLGNNMISGAIPNTFGNMKSLINLDLTNNQISGVIPSTFGNLIHLKRIYLKNNRLEGCFPVGMQKYCVLSETDNQSTVGYNFRQNKDLIFEGDFGRWCVGEGRAKAQIMSNAPLCEGSDLVLNGSGGIIFNWSGPQGYISGQKDNVIPSVNPDQLGKYTLVVVNENKCTDTTSFVVQSIGMVSASGNGPVCEGVTIELKADGGISYTWSGPAGFNSILQNPIIQNAKTEMEGTYVVEIKTNDCTIFKNVPIEFVKTAEISSNSPVCEGDTLQLNVTNGVNINWTGPDGFVSDKKSPVLPVSSLKNDGKYVAVIKNADNCTFSLTTDVVITKRLTPDFPDFTVICENTPPLNLPGLIDNFSGSWVGAGISGTNPNQIFNPFGLKGIQNLAFVPVNDGKCVGPLKTDIFVSYLSVAASEQNPSIDAKDSNGGIILQLEGNTNGLMITYEGPDSGTLKEIKPAATAIDNLSSGDYLIAATDIYGCIDTTYTTVRYLRPSYFLPNVVAPESDSENNRFYLKGSNIFSYDLTVFDRWGNLVYDNKNMTVNDLNTAWIPTINDKGVFVYVLKLETIEGIKVAYGSITVI
jgi:Leucine-rich repeat (LRR) protein